jgi:antitoxin ParD1/3/4
MDVTLPAEFDAMIRRRVESGRYGSAAEVVGEALRLLEERDRLHEQRLEGLRREIDLGIDEADRGLLEPFDMADIRAEVKAILDAEREAV